MARKKIETGSIEESQKAELSNRIWQIRQTLFDDNNRLYSQKILVNEQALSQICSGKRNAGIEIVQRILENITEISPDWLLLGKGEMLRENCKNAPARAYEFGDEHPGMNASESNGHQLRINSESTPSQLRDDNPSWERYNNALIEVGILRERLARASVTIATLQRQLSTEGEKTASPSAPTDTVVTLV